MVEINKNNTNMKKTSPSLDMLFALGTHLNRTLKTDLSRGQTQKLQIQPFCTGSVIFQTHRH